MEVVKLVLVNGVRRSGNHAIIDWLLTQSQPPFIHLNDCDPVDANPFNVFAQAKIGGFPFWKLKPSLRSILRHGLTRHPFFRFVKSDRKVRWHFISSCSYNLAIVSVEDRTTAELETFAAQVSDYLQPSECFVRTIIRDPYNLFASLCKSERATEQTASRLRATWMDHVQATAAHDQILFNDWLANSEYRLSILSHLNISGSAERYKRVSVEGGGSSFSGIVDPEALTCRWMAMIENDLWKRTVLSNHVRDAASRLFPTIAAQVDSYLSDRKRPTDEGPTSPTIK